MYGFVHALSATNLLPQVNHLAMNEKGLQLGRSLSEAPINELYDHSVYGIRMAIPYVCMYVCSYRCLVHTSN